MLLSFSGSLLVECRVHVAHRLWLTPLTSPVARPSTNNCINGGKNYLHNLFVITLKVAVCCCLFCFPLLVWLSWLPVRTRRGRRCRRRRSERRRGRGGSVGVRIRPRLNRWAGEETTERCGAFQEQKQPDDLWGTTCLPLSDWRDFHTTFQQLFDL